MSDHAYFFGFQTEYITIIICDESRYSPATKTSSASGFKYKVQTVDFGEMADMGGNDHIRDLVRTCPAAFQMMNMSDKEIRKAVKENAIYIHEVLETFNKCQ